MATIRPCRTADIDSLYSISLATGHEGGDAAQLYRDPRLLGHIYSAPYATLEPGLALVVEDQAGVAGFAVGVVDTCAWESRLERSWWPALRRCYPDPGGVAAPDRTADQRRAFAIHHPEPVPTTVSARYPAHLHMNLLPRVQRRGLGAELLGAWLAVAGERGARCIHVGGNRANSGAIGFWQKHGFLRLDAPQARTLYFGRDVEPDE